MYSRSMRVVFSAKLGIKRRALGWNHNEKCDLRLCSSKICRNPKYRYILGLSFLEGRGGTSMK